MSGRGRVYSDAELGVRFEIDDSFAPGPDRESPAAAPGREPPAAVPGDVRSVHLVAPGLAGGQAVLSISRVAAGYETSPHELADHLLIHNRYAAHTAEQNGWTIHSPWKAALLAGYPAMHCDYVVPEASESAGHVQEWIAYAGRQTFQLMLGVDPPGDLAGNRALMETIVRTFEIGEPPAGDAGDQTAPVAGEPPPGGLSDEIAPPTRPAPD